MARTEIKYVGRLSDIFVRGLGAVKRGEVTLVDVELAKRLIKERPEAWEFVTKLKNGTKKKKGV